MIRKNCKSKQLGEDKLLNCVHSGNGEKKYFEIFSFIFSVIQLLQKELFDISYNLGIYVVKFINNFIKFNDKFFDNKLKTILKKIKMSLNKTFIEIKISFCKLYRYISIIINIIKLERKNGLFAILNRLKRLFLNKVKCDKKIIYKFLDYVYPIVGIGFLVATISIIANSHYALDIECMGKHIGCIEDEYVFNSASNDMNSKIIYDENEKPLNISPKYTIVRIGNKDKCDERFKISNKLLKVSNKIICEASGLYVDSKFIGAVKENRQLQYLLDDIKKPYQEKYPDAAVSFVEDVKIEDGYYLVSNIFNINEINKRVSKKVQNQIIYTVRRGDAPLLIAQKNAVPYEQIKQLNPNIEKDLKPGNELLVSKSRPLIMPKVVKKKTECEEIPFDIVQVEDKSGKQGYNKIIQNGQTGVKEKEYEVTIIDDVETECKLVGEKVIKTPVTHKLLVSSQSELQPYVASNLEHEVGTLLWPVAGGYISCGVNGYKGHIAIDIAAREGTSVVAAGSGIVVESKYMGRYGNCVIIQHDDKEKTLYAHNSLNLVSKGDRVCVGQAIALVGRTGNASGSHCHFEVRERNIPVNPMPYLKIKNR